MKTRHELEVPRIDDPNTKRTLTLIRPLLFIEKSELIDFLNENGQKFCTDLTNFEADGARNFLRLRVMPEIKSGINRSAVKNICRLGEIASEDERFLKENFKKQ